MIKRNKSITKRSDRKRSLRQRRRRLALQGLESRELLAGEFGDIGIYTGPRNVGTVQANQVFESENISQAGQNDFYNTADFINLGTGPGQLDTIDLIGSMRFTATSTNPPEFITDLDTFAFDLRAGDILDVATYGAAGAYTILDANGQFWYGVDGPQSFGYPADSPLQNQGLASFAQVVPEDGRYYLSLAPTTTEGNYTAGLRVYRPVVESLPIGSQQILYVDLDGGFYPRSVFSDGTGLPQPGVVRIPGLRESLPLLGINQLDTGSYNRLIDLSIAETQRMFAELGNSTNGDYVNTGNPGDFGITILNSRDHADPGFNPLVTRVILGGTVDDIEIDTIGISETIDIGNFSMDDIVIGALDSVLDIATIPPIGPNASIVEAISDFLAFLISHEAGHSFGMRHTTSDTQPQKTGSLYNIMDQGPGSDFEDTMGIGPDGIFGTIDDVNVDFIDDVFAQSEGLDGFNYTPGSLSNTLGTGTMGGGLSGRVFQDRLGDGFGAGDLGQAGVLVYADVNNNGVLDPSEPRQITGADGTYALGATPGSYNIVAEAPPNQAPTTPTVVAVNVSIGSNITTNFGFSQIVADITGTVFADNDGDGLQDTGDIGVEGIYVYLDLDGDDRPDLGEPATHTAADGTYSLTFPGAGNYTIRDVVPAGFEQTFPVGGEHNVFFDGISLNNNYDFGLLPSQDFGDAPASYGTTTAADGARHGIVPGLALGTIVDREGEGQPSVAADGDDATGLDDEDGVALVSPLAPGASATFEVTVTNTASGAAYLQGFMDFNQDGDFTDPGEQFLADRLISSGVAGETISVPINVPAGAALGTTYARFRIAQESGLGATGFTTSGEVEDYTFPILNAAEIANDDEFSVSRNSLSNTLDVLANDFETAGNQLAIESLNLNGTEGVVVNGGDQLFYTPPNGFIGRDVFSYTVVDQFNNRSTASVVVNVLFQSNVPIALDDTFEVPEGSTNRPLNVLDNDVPSIFGGISITSVTAGSAGGTLSVVGGGQSIRYTPLPGFNGTEQFTYTIQDSAGSTSQAQVTVNLLPGSRVDDVVEFTVGVFDAVNTNTPIDSVQVGDDFLVRVSVTDLRFFANPEGVASAFLDMLYTDELVSTLDTDNNPDFPFDISFGPLFSGINVFQQGDAQIPGLINEVGGLQRIDDQMQHGGPAELFTLRMRAVSPGIAVFTADPADEPVSETVVLGSDVALTPSQLRLGSTDLTILPDSDVFTAAIDDSFPDGRDSDGNPITNASVSRNRLDVLNNDNLGPTGNVREFGLVTNPALGNVFIDDNGTPGNLNDDFFSYRANTNANGLERFTYVIVTDDNVRSTAEVTIALGNQNATADVAIDFGLVAADGVTPIDPAGVAVGERIGLQVYVEDLRNNPTFVFAGFLDVLYDTSILRPGDLNQGDDFNFDVVFGPEYSTSAGVGTAARPGIIDEFGTLLNSANVPDSEIPNLNPGLLATIFFDAVNVGTTSVVGSPADSSPFQDTLLYREDNPVSTADIRYDSLSITVTSSGVPLQNLLLPQDVNVDGVVSPIDALLIINEMGRVSGAEGENVGGVSQYYTDVNGDQKISALDALQVINYLTRQSNSGASGEQVVLLSDEKESTSTGSADAVFADLGSEEKIVSTGAPTSQGGADTTPANGDAGDDDGDDTLDLLASDVDTIWS
ncbi:MAG: Ig-like domain-containing protein [Rubripirellula sp.]